MIVDTSGTDANPDHLALGDQRMISQGCSNLATG